MAPNCKHIVEALAHEYPQEFNDCHRPERGERAWAFIRRVAWVLHTTVDVRFGLNGKRGNVNDPSMDAVSFRNPSSGAGGVEIYDVVGGAGGPSPSAAWIDVTQATIDHGTTGAYIQPEPVHADTRLPPITPAPPEEPKLPPPARNCKFVACDCKSDIAGLYEAVTNLIVKIESLADRNEQLHATAVGHIDDAKQRIERVSQELANKSSARADEPPPSRWPWWR